MIRWEPAACNCDLVFDDWDNPKEFAVLDLCKLHAPDAKKLTPKEFIRKVLDHGLPFADTEVFKDKTKKSKTDFEDQLANNFDKMDPQTRDALEKQGKAQSDERERIRKL
jgi:hypothetical protein